MEIQLAGVAKRFGSRHALRNVSFRVPAGSIVVVLGANGAGKSTLLRILAGVCAPDRGHIGIDGIGFDRERLDLRRRLLYTPEVPLLFPEDTVARNIALFAGIYGASLDGRDAELEQWFTDLGIVPWLMAPVHTLSRGFVWKAALACVAVVRPELWLVDEPFASGMDPAGLAAFRKLARSLAATGSTVIATTQIVELCAGFSRSICSLQEGYATGLQDTAQWMEGRVECPLLDARSLREQGSYQE